MAEGIVDKTTIGRRRIIERPRLTRLLDESPARIKLLVAPAGYGKTTLARQWVASRHTASVWVTCVHASSDVALLLSAVARASKDVASRSTHRTLERLSAAPDPTRELEALLDLLIADLTSCPPATLLVLDDYHELMSSPDAEHVVHDVVRRTELDVLIASRRRPTWATARSLIHGELVEMSQAQLAMTSAETNQVLGRDPSGPAAELVLSANGWPAFVALAAATDDLEARPTTTQERLYEYLAAEVLLAAAPETQAALRELSLAPRDHAWLLRQLHSRATARRVETEAVGLGMFAESSDGFELHPLLQRVLLRDALQASDDDRAAAFARLWSVLCEGERWDDLFALVVRARRPQSLPELFQAALEPLLVSGRTATLRRWITYAHECELDDAIIKVADAEVALRAGQATRAEVIAIEAAQAVDSCVTEDAARALCIAGQAAHLQSNDRTALDYFQRASSMARTKAVVAAARWGTFVVAIDLETSEAEETLTAIIESAGDDARGTVARWNAQLLYEVRLGGVKSLRGARAAHEVIDRVTDPVRRTAFRSVHCSALTMAGEYADALQKADLFLEDVRASRVDFALPYAHTVRGAALIGLRRFDDAMESILRGEAEAVRIEDEYAVTNARATRSRLLIATGEFDEAVRALEIELRDTNTRGMVAEVLASRALALACLCEPSALDSANEARAITRSLESRVLAAMADAIVASTTNRDVSNAAVAAFDLAREYGAWDLFVCGYRGHPEVLLPLREGSDRVAIVRAVMLRAHDEELIKLLSLDEPLRGVRLLSPREAEIHSLVALGLSNREIAARLVISEATVKLHVRHIFEKLGVRSRTAAAARYLATRRPDQDADAST